MGTGEQSGNGASDCQKEEESFGVWDEGGKGEAAGEGDGGVA